jgi:CRISPR-associated endonuclease Csn1
MNAKNFKDYYVGLDVGTDSCGWAVTDDTYDLVKAGGHELWGSYMFENAQTAEERRMARTSRRRTARAHERLMLLQELFADEISKVDPLFFIRLNNSQLFLEDKDKSLSSANILFDDKQYADKDYFKDYKTIYHLRSELIDKPITDIRFLYLAVHHIIKNRGHFLYDGQTFDVNDKQNVLSKFEEVNNFLSVNDMPTLELVNINDVLTCLKDKHLGKKAKTAKLKELFGVTKDKQHLAIINALSGCNFSIDDLYSTDEEFDPHSLLFDDSGYDEKYLKIENQIGVDDCVLIRDLKAIYDWAILSNIIGDYKFISQAKVKVFKDHQNDLEDLKTYLRNNYDKETYKKVFRYKKGVPNYAAYIGMDKQKSYAKCSKDEFYSFLKNKINIKDEAILKRINDGDFMPKQVSSANGVIPYQLNYAELEAILNNAQKYFPFLAQEQEGLTVSQRILMLMRFKIPYYVGPLNDKDKKFAWVKKFDGMQNVKVTPWNFDKIVDLDASEDQFFSKMTNKCTYLPTEDVLPANSLLYSTFAFLNELNNLKINGVKSRQARDLIFEYAKSHKKVTQKACLNLLEKNAIIPNDSTTEIFSGIDGDFKCSLAPFIDLKFLGDKLYTMPDMCEEIILWITCNSDKNRLAKRIKEKYGKYLTDEEIKRFKGFTYSKWGRLSKTLLCGIKSPRCTDENGECLSIIQAMFATGENFMQLLSDKYGFADSIKEYREANKQSTAVTYKTVKELYCSPSVKRAIWRSLDIVKEIEKIMGKSPKKIFIEMAREPADDARKGKRTISRKEQIKFLYKDIKDNERDWKEEIEETPDSKFNSDRLVLYYMQKGVCMYTGKRISLQDVFNTNICDIDHIYPQSKIKDDSLDNRVLVLKTANSEKTDEYPIKEEIRHKMCGYWKELLNGKFITEKKYSRLMRNTPLTVEECTDFINRQLVETRQSTKCLAQILREYFDDTCEVVYSKADNVNRFKQENKIIKIRELNDLHHAKDAYLNIVVGNVYNTKFNHDARVYFANHDINSYNMNNLFDRDMKGAWVVDDRKRVVDIANKNTCRVVRMTESGKGKLFDVKPVSSKGQKADKLVNWIPRKLRLPNTNNSAITDVAKYGGYTGINTAYYMLVKSEAKKGHTNITFVAYPLYLQKIYNGDYDNKIKYCIEKFGLKEPQILVDEIKKNTLIYINGVGYYLTGGATPSETRIKICNTYQLNLESAELKILKEVVKSINSKKKYNKMILSSDLTKTDAIQLYDGFIQKLSVKPYVNLPTIENISAQLKEKKSYFEELSLPEQCEVLYQILHLMQCNKILSNLTLLGLNNNCGEMRMTNNFTFDNDIKIIYQSPTGYYKKVINVKDLI